MKYTASSEVLAANLSDEAVLLHLGSKRYYRLNESAAILWKTLERSAEREDLIEQLTREFEVDRSTAAAEVDRVLGEFTKLDLVVTQP